MHRDDAHLLDILKAARLAIEFKGLAGKAAFLADAKTQSAVLHQLLILGEAGKRLSPQFRIAHPEIPWEGDRRNARPTHPFLRGVDLDEVWKMVASDLPALIRAVELLAPTKPSDADPDT